MITVTVDTNVFPISELPAALEPHGFKFVPITVSQREVKNTSFEEVLKEFTPSREFSVWGENVWGGAQYASADEASCLEKALSIISNGSFPKPGRRDNLKPSERRQLRDAIILCTHRRDGRDILLTNDRKAFINGGRREKILNNLGVQVLSLDEFRARYAGYLTDSAPPAGPDEAGEGINE